jgi:glutathione S-transferase
VIRLYRAAWSTNVERVTLALAHKGLEAESIWIDYGDRRPVEQVSGQPLVPVVDFDGEIVFDSARIIARLEREDRITCRKMNIAGTQGGRPATMIFIKNP